MRRLVLATVMAFSAAQAVLAAPGDVTVVKPTAVYPQTQLGDEELQKQYDDLWKAYTDQVDDTTKALEKQLNDLHDDAQQAGNLDLTLFWEDQLKSFIEKGTVRWEPAAQRTAWKKYGGAAFPEGLAATLAKSVAEYDKAKASLEDGYKSLEVALTRAGKVPQARDIRSECASLWTGPQKQPSPVEPPRPAAGKVSVNLLEGLDVKGGRSEDCWRMEGKCLRCDNHGTFTFKHPDIQRFAKQGEYDLAFQVVFTPAKKDGSTVAIELPGIPGSPSLLLRHIWSSPRSKVSLVGSNDTNQGGTRQPSITVDSPVTLDGSKKINVTIQVRLRGSSVTVLLNGGQVIDCKQFPDKPVSSGVSVFASRDTDLTICDLTISDPGD